MNSRSVTSGEPKGKRSSPKSSERAKRWRQSVNYAYLADITPVSDPFAWTREVVDSGWPDADIINLIRSRQVELIVLAHDVRTVKADSSQDRWPKSVAEAIEHNYQLVRTFDCAAANFVYQPETPP